MKGRVVMSMKMYEMKVKVTFTDALLGTLPNNTDVFTDYILSKALEAGKTLTDDEIAAEVAALKSEAEVNEELAAQIEKGTTVFPRTSDGTPFIYDYQWRGFFKEACKFLKKVDGTLSSKEKAYKQKIDGMIFVKDRENPIEVNGEIGICERPLRASGPSGERVALSRSESVPEGSTCTFTVQTLVESDLKLVKEWLDYGALHGTGQWRNAGRGRYTWELIDV